MKRYFWALILILLISLPGQAQESTLVTRVLAQLKLKPGDCKEDFIVEQQLPYDKEKSIVVIPKIAVLEEDYFALESYILLVDNKSGKILNRFWESPDDNEWTSDAVRIDGIWIDTAPYKIKTGVRAFGIGISFSGSSRPNPYSKQMMSLFIPEGDSLRCVLKNYELSVSHGEWGMNCVGTFTEEQKTLIVSNKPTNNYFDIQVRNIITNRTDTKVGGDCVEKEKVTTKQAILKYRNGRYQ